MNILETLLKVQYNINYLQRKIMYKIIRMKREGKSKVIKRGLTLDEAQAHCSLESTHGEGWFDGYEEE